MKKTNRMIAMALAAAVTTSVVPTTAFAEDTNNDSSSTTSTTTHSDGSSTSTTTSSESSSSGNGSASNPTTNTTVSVTVTVNTDNTGNETSNSTETKTETESSGTTTTQNTDGSTTVDTTESGSTATETRTKETTASSVTNTTTVESAGGGVDSTSTTAADNNTPGEPTGKNDGTFTGTDGNPVDAETAEYLKNFNEGTTTTTTTETDLNHTETNTMEYDGKGRPVHETGSASGSTSTTTVTTTVVKSETEHQQVGESTTKLMDETEQPQGEDREKIETGTYGEQQNQFQNELGTDELPSGDIAESDEQDLTASINGAAGVGATSTTEETLARDWNTTYNNMVTDAMNKVKETAANEAVADKKNNDAAVAMTEGTVAGHTNPENNADGDYKYRYTGETATDTYEKVVTITKATDANGNVTFTTTTEVIVTPKEWTNEQTVKEGQLKEDEYAYTYGEVEESEPVVTYEVKLPAKPALGEVTTDADGKTMTVVEVRDHFEEVNGVMTHVGYEKIFEIKDKDGNVINAGEASHTINGEIIRTEVNTKEVEKTTEISEFTQKTTVTEKDVEKRVTTSTVTMDMDDATRQLVVKLLGAEVGEAVIGGNKYVHGELEGMEAINPDTTKKWNQAQHDIWTPASFRDNSFNNDEGLKPFQWNDYIVNNNIDVKAPENEFALTGWGLVSALQVNRTDEDGSGNSDVHQYLLQDEEGKDFYALCVEMGQGLDWYGEDGDTAVNYVMENLDEVDYFDGGEEAKENIRKVVLNGFWGTTGNQKDANGNEIPNTPETGSLEAVRNMLKANGWTEAEANSLTEGQALTATQAAIWHYGNDGGEKLTDLAHLVQNERDEGAVSKNDIDNKNVVKMFNTLLGLSNVTTEEKESNLIDLEDVTATITAKEKVEEGTTDIDNDGKVDDKYNTDVSFTLAVIPTANDQLMVVVQNNQTNEILKSVDLNSFDGTNGCTKTTDNNGNTTYTMSNIELTEGVNINLSIDGAQYLKQGVYVYRSEGFDTSDTSKPHSQTMVGIAEGYRSVSMDMNLTFSVDEADDVSVSGSRSGYEQTRKDKKYRTDNYVTETKEVSALMEVTTTTITTEEQEWEGAYEDTWKYKKGGDEPGTPDTPDTPETPDDPGVDIHEEEVPLADIPEEEVPLADVPEEPVVLGEEEVPLIAATGDSNHMTAGFGGMFAALAGMFFLRKKKEQ